MPWCSNSKILKREGNQVEASLELSWSGISKTFTTKNTLRAYDLIEIELLDGPFKTLSGQWRFEALGEGAAKVALELQFSFKSKLMDIALSPIFTQIANSQLDAFVARGKQKYG